MLEHLHIKNLALIKEEEVSFSDGLHILTGETGAGKSVILGSVDLALGARAESDAIRSGEEQALAELTFVLGEDEERRVSELGFLPESDHTLIISRKIMPGRSVCRVNGETVTLSKLRELASCLITIHGQHDHQALLSPSWQKDTLDDHIGESLYKEKERLKALRAEHEALKKELDELFTDETALAREADLLKYEIQEIDGARLIEGEEEALEAAHRKMSNSKRIGEAIGAARAALSVGGDMSLSDAVGRAGRELRQVLDLDPELDDIVRQTDDIDSLLQDLSRALDDAAEGLRFDDAEYRSTEERLDTIRRLEDKYGADVGRLLILSDEKKERLESLEHAGERRAEGERRLSELREEMERVCSTITDIRRRGAKELSEKIEESLEDCNFNDVLFEIAVEPDREDIGPDGWDRVRFDIRTNPGEELRPIDQIASGGELSRIMLAIKTVFADKNDTPTLIFDEIDAGISGKTAWMVSKKLSALARERQVICITHLPQIAAMADHHYEIKKEIKDSRTVTGIRELNDDESISEIARLLSGDEVTELSLVNARQLKERAAKEKR